MNRGNTISNDSPTSKVCVVAWNNERLSQVKKTRRKEKPVLLY